MAKIKVKVDLVGKNLTYIISILEEELKKVRKKQEKFIRLCAKAVMLAYNKKCIFGIGKINKVQARWRLISWDNREKFRKYTNRDDKYIEDEKKICDSLNSTKLILEAVNYAKRRDNAGYMYSKYVSLDSTECRAINTAEKLCDKIARRKND